MTKSQALLEELPVLHRLALSYAPAATHQPTMALLALDARLAGVVRSASEPMLAQLRLAWWREQLATDPSTWPSGEPLLAALKSWQGERQALVGLVNGWEEITGQAPLAATALDRLAEARGHAFAALAEHVGASADRAPALRLAHGWALADIAAHLSHPEEQSTARRLTEAHDWSRARLSRPMRPLAVMHGLAARAARRGKGLDELSPLALFAALRLGLLGR